MSTDVLRVRATGNGLVQDYERLEAGTNAFVGRRFVERQDKPGQYAFVATDEVAEVPYRVEYVKALQTGDLEPADAATAMLAGVKWKAPAPVFSPATDDDEKARKTAQKGDR